MCLGHLYCSFTSKVLRALGQAMAVFSIISNLVAGTKLCAQ